MHTVSDVDPASLAPHLQAAPSMQSAMRTEAVPVVRWRLGTRLAFRFSALYILMYVLVTQMLPGMLPVPGIRSVWPGAIEPLQNGVRWVARTVFGFSGTLAAFGGSGDKAYDYTIAFCLVAVAATLTALWSLVDRRPAHPALYKWFRLFLRFALAGTMASYGMAKVIPTQMPYPTLLRLVEPYGHFSMMGVLWTKIGASPAYEMFTGLVELATAVLLIVPGLATLGALLSVTVSAQIFTLNMTYDVPVKLFSLHLIVFSLVLLAPDMRRLFNLLVLNRAVPAPSHVPLVRNRRLRVVLIAMQLAFGGWLVWSNYNRSMQGYRTFGGGAPRPPLYGIWEIERMTIQDVERLPLVTDYDRWRRVIIQRAEGITFQRMDDTFLTYATRTSEDLKTITLTSGPGTLNLERPAEDRLILEGEVAGRKVRMETRKNDLSAFRLLQSEFRWMQETPFNR